MNNLKTFNLFLNEKLGDGYTSTCSNCGYKLSSNEIKFDVENSHDRGGIVIASYICPKCRKSSRIRTILSPVH